MKKILIADDNLQITKVLSEFAKKKGLSPLSPRTGIPLSPFFKAIPTPYSCWM